MIPSDRPKIRG